MIYLVDTNVLLRIVHRTDVRHSIAQAAVHKLETKGHQLQTTSQNFAEFWNASTRPTERNGFGLTSDETDTLLGELEESFPLLPDSSTVYPVWRRLVVKYDVSGVQVHDARLAAAMIAHNVAHILTFNVTDFERYKPEKIVAVDPAAV
ncbi:MAG: type II toxin-antitoxin system VapC family toxin [Candidatus Poribacteria bacterium]|nr:type II toxin-antitoxin system VapC family toxin [Candidatus Poribacteria bacterium]